VNHLAIDYSLTGCANGARMLLSGSGHLDAAAASLQVTVEGGGSLHWDPALAVLDGLPALITVALRLPASGDDADPPVLGQTRSVLHDDQGREVGNSICSYHSQREGDRLVHRTQVVECVSRLEVLEHITSIDAPFRAVAMPGAGDTRILTHTLSFSTSRGSSYSVSGMTTWRPAPEAVGLTRLTISAVDMHRACTSLDEQVLTVAARFVVDRLAVR